MHFMSQCVNRDRYPSDKEAVSTYQAKNKQRFLHKKNTYQNNNNPSKTKKMGHSKRSQNSR